MPNLMRMRASLDGDTVTVRVLMTHPEDTGLIKGPDGKPIPAHFIQTVVCKHGDTEVLHCDWGIAVSKNPFLEFGFKGGKSGDTVSVTWLDNLGETQTGSTTVS